MKEELTKEKLIEYDFPKDFIERLMTWKDYSGTCANDHGYFYASNIDGKIYSGVDVERKKPNIVKITNLNDNEILEYFNIRLEQHLSKSNTGVLYNEHEERECFIDTEIKKTEVEIKNKEDFQADLKACPDDQTRRIKMRANSYNNEKCRADINRLNSYIRWLKKQHDNTIPPSTGKAKKIFQIWNDMPNLKDGYVNIFNGMSETDFINMLNTKDFSKVLKKRNTNRIAYTIYKLSEIMGSDWGEIAAKSINLSLSNCQKRTSFNEKDTLCRKI